MITDVNIRRSTCTSLVRMAVVAFLILKLAAAEPPELMYPSLNVTVTARDTYYISIKWEINDANSTIETYEVIAENLDKNYRVVYQGLANIDPQEKRSDVRVHGADTAYNICIVAYLKTEASAVLGDDTVTDCVETKTIPVLLLSSIIAFSICVGFFVFMSILGCFCWKVNRCVYKYHKYEMTKTHENGVNHRAASSYESQNESSCNIEA